MNRIFCLETEWVQSIHDLKKKATAKDLLDFLDHADDIKSTFRQVASVTDFEYYINHLFYNSYNPYDIVYLCFHGAESSISFANSDEKGNKEQLDIIDFAESHEDIFRGKTVHFGCCSVLNMDEDEIKKFKKYTGARLITGYRTNVPFEESFVFELWLLYTFYRHPDYGPKRIMVCAEKEMQYYVTNLKFKAY